MSEQTNNSAQNGAPLKDSQKQNPAKTISPPKLPLKLEYTLDKTENKHDGK